MKIILRSVLLLLACASALAQTSSPEAAIMQADRDFQTATEKRGAQGWASFFAEQGIVTLEKPVIGPAAIQEAYKAFLSTPGLIFKWHPVKAEMFPGNNKGYTVGRYEITTPDKDGKHHTRTGTYMTVWEKQQDSSWKVIFDTGAPDPAPTAK